MKKIVKRKLQLSKETLANLNERELAKIVGGETHLTAYTECNTDCTCPNTQ
jgi:natural product precursor